MGILWGFPRDDSCGTTLVREQAMDSAETLSGLLSRQAIPQQHISFSSATYQLSVRIFLPEEAYYTVVGSAVQTHGVSQESILARAEVISGP